ncbi:MAG: UDP-N-acetylmuramoyl-tripeptide--D-alanyl-D-alanine ligase [Clostridiales bacterium]|nr:UDP-N-acetylmuramoyl-tripeptide--D-alanyl-D-alanine ligase [Clostridiales bacterium]
MNLWIDEVQSLFDCCDKEHRTHQLLKGVSTDSRDIKVGQLFIALKGENFDGHNYIDKAIKKGASLILSEKNHLNPKVIKVDDTIKALGLLAKYYRLKFSIPVIALTGSVGKTTTKNMINSVLSTLKNVHTTKGNKNNHIGLPMSLFNLTSEHDVSILEMGMNHLGEIDYLSSIAKPTISILTNIGVSHIGNLGSKENIFIAKKEMLNHLLPKSLLLINGDDEFLMSLQANSPYRVITYGFSSHNTVKASHYKTLEDNKGSQFMIGHELYTLNTLGKHNVYNALPAITLGNEFGLSTKMINQGLKTFSNEKMRMNISKIQGMTIINDAYNANTQSMKAAIDVLDIQKGRKVAILGDMLEMGDFSKDNHFDVGKHVANSLMDVLIGVGNDASFYIDGAKSAKNSNLELYYFEDLSYLEKNINDIIKQGDSILLKGSRGSKMETVIEFINKKE